MTIDKRDLSEMNALLSRGKTIAQLDRKYPKYGYWNIYEQVIGPSFHGQKRAISNRLKKLATANAAERRVLAADTKKLLDALYDRLQANNKKLASIARVLEKTE